ncbi:MAG: GAF domain-containing protein [Nitrospiraceae bacterium]|nr:GAF domain-containing protein [Nitrospiraceae bacterium]
MSIDENIPWLQDVSPGEVRRIVDALYRVHQLIPAITDVEALLERIMEVGKTVARAEACSILLHDKAAGELYFLVAQGESGDQQALKREVRLKMDEGIAGFAATTRQSINVPDVTKDERFYKGADEVSRFETRSVLAVPLTDHDELLGVLEVLNKVGGGPFTDTDLHVLDMFSSLAASSLANARLIEENLRAARLAAIGQAIAGLSHYTKNIVASMTGSTELIDQGLSTGNTDMLKRCWPILKRSTNRISDFVQDMLAFSKPREPMREPCYVGALLEDAVRTFTGLQQAEHPQVDIQIEGLEAPVSIDAQGVFRCILNLLTNAADAISADSGRINVSARASDGALVIEVSDNGPGVPRDKRAQIFEPFFSTKGSRGTGLGLAVTQKIIHEHGGGVVLEEAPGGGALFRITLPDAVKDQ